MHGADRSTLDVYDRKAEAFADDWESQPAPSDLYAIIRRFFVIGLSADIGCGSGRDAAWLDANGYPTIGFDASEGLLNEARKRHPHLQFRLATLPNLEGVADASFVNVLCETVIMHLKRSLVASAVGRLLGLLVTGGTLYLSWRIVDGADRRDDQGRLYAVIDSNEIMSTLTGCEVLLDEEVGSSSSGKLIRRVVVRKP